MKNVIFDLGGVVLEWNPEQILRRYYTDEALRTLMRSAFFRHPDWLDLDRGTLQEAELVSRVAVRTGRPAAELEGLLEAVRESLHTKPDTIALLEKLFARGVPLFCLSNMASSIFAYLRQRHSFWHVFRGIVISGDLKIMKPEPEIFQHLLALYGLSPGETVFVDDHEPNVKAARALGLQAVWFKDTQQCERELEQLLSA